MLPKKKKTIKSVITHLISFIGGGIDFLQLSFQLYVMFYGKFGDCITLPFIYNFTQIFAFKFTLFSIYFRYGLLLREVSYKDAQNYLLGKLIKDIFPKMEEK